MHMSGRRRGMDQAAVKLESWAFVCHTYYVPSDSTQRAHIMIPADLLREIDQLVGPRGRSAFLLETAREELKRRKLLRFLESDDPAWKERDHPNIKDSAGWVRKLRAENETRLTRSGAKREARTRKSRG
jgi:hypothetical protein